MHLNYEKLFKELKNGIEILVGRQAVFKVNIKTVKMLVLDQYNNWRTAWPTLILMLFLSSLDNLL